MSANLSEFVLSLEIKGLRGRVLEAPAARSGKRHILLLYGQHATLERWFSLVENLMDYGSVTMPDLPGIGGMDSFEKIGQKPDLDAFADYLADFMNLRFKEEKVTIVGVSLGFVIATRMLQRHPQLTGRVELLVSLVGSMHESDYHFTGLRRNIYAAVGRLFATRPMAFFISHALINKFVIKTLYPKLPNSKRRMIEITPEEFSANIELEYEMWRGADTRTYWLTLNQLLTLDNCKRHVNLPVVHVASKKDHYLNNESVERHMRGVFSSYQGFMMDSKAHTPSILADKQATGIMLPDGLRRILAKEQVIQADT